MLGNPASLLAHIRENDVVLDVGGGAIPFARANYVLDLGSYSERRQALGPGPERFTEKTWVVQDVCDRKGFPFPDKFFDFVIASHVLATQDVS